MSRGISTSDKVLAPAFVTNIFVTRTFWAGAIRKINKCAIKEIKATPHRKRSEIVPNVIE